MEASGRSHRLFAPSSLIRPIVASPRHWPDRVGEDRGIRWTAIPDGRRLPAWSRPRPRSSCRCARPTTRSARSGHRSTPPRLGGFPPHVTVLYPFLPPGRIDERVLSIVGGVVAAVPRFEVTFRRVGWFGDTVVWLAPEPCRPFRALTAAVWRRFPETPPYAGAHTDSTPHLTIGHDAPRPLLERAAEAVSTRLPIQADVRSVRLISGSPEPDSWPTVAARSSSPAGCAVRAPADADPPRRPVSGASGASLGRQGLDRMGDLGR